MGQMACSSEPRQIQQGTSILSKPGSPSELELRPMWPVPRNPTGLPVILGTWATHASRVDPRNPSELALWARWPVPRNLGKHSKEHQFWASQAVPWNLSYGQYCLYLDLNTTDKTLLIYLDKIFIKIVEDIPSKKC